MRSILLACPADSPLLAPGVAGARPPTAYQQFHEDYGHLASGTWDAAWTPNTDDDYTREEGHTALVLLWDGEVCVEGCDRVLRAIRPLRLAEREDYEARARAVYESWPESAGHPWTPGGNSEKQYEARCAAGPNPRRFAPVLDYTYSPERATLFAAEAERLGLGRVVVIEEVSGG